MNADAHPQKTAMCVLCMHRSGSSALTRALNLLGFDVGSPETLTRSKSDNPRGFWEQEPLQLLNDRILRHLGRTWETTTPIPPEALCQLKPLFLTEMRATLHRIFQGHPQIVWKDPRNLLLFDLWREALQAEGYSVIPLLCLRHPASVAQSLRIRNGIPPLKGLAIWVAYHARIPDLFAEFPLPVIDYDRLLNDPLTELRSLLQTLNLPWPASPPEEELTGFLAPDLRHNLPAALAADNLPFGFPVEDLYHALQEHRPGEPLPDELCQALDAYLPSTEIFATDLAAAQLASDALAERHHDLEDAYHHLEDAHRGLEERTRTAIAELEARHHKTLAALRQSQEACREFDTWNRHLQSQYQSHLQHIEHLNDERRRLHDSLSWKITSPLRGALYLLRVLTRVAGIGCTEFPAAWRLLRTEGLPSLIRQTRQRIRTEQDLIRVGTPEQDPPSASAPAPSESPDSKARFVQTQQQALDRFIAQDGLLDFTPTAPPRVTVLLVLHNRAELTFACLQSLLEQAGMPIHLVLIDNASTDQTPELLQRIRGATLKHNSENLHFLRACNQVLSLLKTEYLLLLNNDTRLHPGALEAALQTFGDNPRVGAVGGKILLLDGSLQEAGSIIWHDGACMGYGRGGDPDAPEYNFVRNVDFCSGAFLLTPVRLFEELGGFDERFAPAYYEETDYCMRLRALGYATVYQPRVCIEHFEFASSGAPSQAIDLQIRNRKTFVEIHRNTLRAHFFQGEITQILKARFAAPAGPKLLYVDDRVPHPRLGSGFPRARLILNTLADLGYQVTLVPLNFPEEDSYESAYQVISPRIEFMRGVGRQQLSGFLSTRPGYYDLMWVSRPDNMALLDQCLSAKPALKDHATIIYDAEALFAMREMSRAQCMGLPLSPTEYESKLQKELQLTRQADVIVSVSETEAQAFQQYRTPARSVLISHAVEAAPTPVPFDARADLLFVGNLQVDGSPNVDAVLWFAEQVWPLLRSRLPDLKLHVIGCTGAVSLQRLRNGGIVIHGPVADLTEWYDRCRLFIAPTRFSAGIPLKIIEAAAHGVPSVATGILARQLGWSHGVELAVADATAANLPRQFADRIFDTYTDPDAWTQLRQKALDRIRDQFSPDQLRRGVLEAVQPQTTP